METVKRSVIVRTGTGDEKAEHRGFLEQEKKYVVDIIMKDTCHCIIIQTHKMCNTKSNP